MMVHYIILYYIILYHIILYYIILYYIILYYIILYYIILYYIILYYIILYYIILISCCVTSGQIVRPRHKDQIINAVQSWNDRLLPLLSLQTRKLAASEGLLDAVTRCSLQIPRYCQEQRKQCRGV